MSSKVNFLTNSFDTHSQHSGDTSNGSDARLPSVENVDTSFIQPKLRALSRHYTSLQEHADHVCGTVESAKNTDLKDRHECRREGFTWGSLPDIEAQKMASRNPLPPERSIPASPPLLADIIHTTATKEDAIGVQHLQLDMLPRSKSFETQPENPTAHLARSSVSGSFSQTDTRRSSIAAFARGLARHVPDLRMFTSLERSVDSHKEPPKPRHDSQDAAMPREKDRKPFVAPSPASKSTASNDTASKPPAVMEEPPGTPTTTNAALPRPSVQRGLKDRRKVNLDLSLPIILPDLPARTRATANALPSPTPSTPRSPQTPWKRNEQPKLEIVKSAPILEEDYIHDSIIGPGTQSGLGLLLGNDVLPSPQTRKLIRPPLRIRDHFYVSRPPCENSRSSRTGISESTTTRTPDGTALPNEQKTLKEKQARMNGELQDLSVAHKTTRSRRWRWEASSEDIPTSSEPRPNRPLKSRFSFNPFQRADRISDKTGDKDKEQSATSNRPRRGNQTVSDQQRVTTSLAQMLLPPTFVPPGVSRVPTPPTFDAEGEVKGKLADFFFDVPGSAAGGLRRKHKSTSGGYWDSDTVLMSMTSEFDQDDEDEDEGPEGPRAASAGKPSDFDLNGIPGMTAGPSTRTEYIQMTGPLTPDSWFRIHHSEMLDDRGPTALTLEEQDERRKFEWLVPEHLPNSPVCPLHPVYKGPCKGVCYWHGRRESGSKSRNLSSGSGRGHRTGMSATEDRGTPKARRGSKDWEVSRYEEPVKEVKKRRLVSLSGS